MWKGTVPTGRFLFRFFGFFRSRESERSAFSTELFGRQGASEECGEVKQIYHNLRTLCNYSYYFRAGMSATEHRLQHTKAVIPDNSVFSSGQGGGVLFCFILFSLFVLQDFRVPLQCVSHQMQNPLQDRWIFKTPQLFCCNHASRATVSL